MKSVAQMRSLSHRICVFLEANNGNGMSIQRKASFSLLLGRCRQPISPTPSFRRSTASIGKNRSAEAEQAAGVHSA
jgi:hypothetical protein